MKHDDPNVEYAMSVVPNPIYWEAFKDDGTPLWHVCDGERLKQPDTYNPRHVPCCIVHVECGLASGLEQRNENGEIVFKIWDTPMPNGEMYTPYVSDTYDDTLDVSDWY